MAVKENINSYTMATAELKITRAEYGGVCFI